LALEKPGKLGDFFLLLCKFVATLKVAEGSGKLNICGGMYLEMI